jgi:hypothetical protein
VAETSNQDDLLTRYLLGDVSDADRTAVEQKYFIDEAGIDQLLRAEDELIDDYVSGVLNPSQRKLFETYFLCTNERRRRLATVKSIVEVLAQMEFAARYTKSEGLERSSVLSREAGVAHGRTASSLATELFVDMLAWLDSDRERAWEKLDTIRRRLIKMFATRGMDDAEALADETIERVASSSSKLSKTFAGDPIQYFLGVSRVVFLEIQKPAIPMAVESVLAGNLDISDRAHDCLEKCLEQLTQSDRELILEYYQSGKADRIAHRQNLARSLNISLNALRLRSHRIRVGLERCVRSCLQEESGEG